MEVTFENCTVSKEVVQATCKVVMALSEIDKFVGKGHWDPDSIPGQIVRVIAEGVAREYLEIHKMNLINSVDLKQITNAIQLKVVEGFSLNR